MLTLTPRARSGARRLYTAAPSDGGGSIDATTLAALIDESSAQQVLIASDEVGGQRWSWRLDLAGGERRGSAHFEPGRIDAGGAEGLVRRLLRWLLAARIGDGTGFENYGQYAWGRPFHQQLRQDDRANRLESEPLIASEGHYPDALIVIRSGFVRVRQRYNNGWRTLAYLGRGRAIGLELFCSDEPQRWPFTLSAVGYADILRIPSAEVRKLLLPHLPAQALEPASFPQVPGEALERLLELRAINGAAAMMIDLDRCTRCDDCVRACAATHDGNPRFVRHGPRIGKQMLTTACMHCHDPVCMIGCPTGAIARELIGGQVKINDLTCIGCAACADNCPYDNIRLVETVDRSGQALLDERNRPVLKATKCDLCVELTGGPACEQACPHDALLRVDMSDRATLAAWLTR
jgi:Fe-S-cluster-containing dehydrogenase component